MRSSGASILDTHLTRYFVHMLKKLEMHKIFIAQKSYSYCAYCVLSLATIRSNYYFNIILNRTRSGRELFDCPSSTCKNNYSQFQNCQISLQVICILRCLSKYIFFQYFQILRIISAKNKSTTVLPSRKSSKNWLSSFARTEGSRVVLLTELLFNTRTV